MRRIVIVCQDVPYPANYGGRVDIWNRVVGLHKLGFDIQLVYWLLKHETISAESQRIIEMHVTEVVQIKRSRSLLNIFHYKYPERMLSFNAKGKNYEKILKRVQSFKPDAILLEGWPGYLVARNLSNDLNKRLIYRAQNVEYLYYWNLVRAASGISKLKLFLTAIKLKRSEVEIRSVSDFVLDLCEADAASWGKIKQDNKWMVLPTTFEFNENILNVNPQIDICYIGNLWTPNNVEGLLWFCKKVMPLINVKVGNDLRIVFAGSNPTNEILQACEANGIQCDANPDDIQPYLVNSRIFINPILQNINVTVKMIELLSTGRPIIASRQAVKNLPNELKKFIIEVSDEDTFASAICEAINMNWKPDNRKAIIARHFGQDKLKETMQKIESIVAKKA